MPKERDVVTEAIAEIRRLLGLVLHSFHGLHLPISHILILIFPFFDIDWNTYNGSPIGNCAPDNNAGSLFPGPLYTS